MCKTKRGKKQQLRLQTIAFQSLSPGRDSGKGKSRFYLIQVSPPQKVQHVTAAFISIRICPLRMLLVFQWHHNEAS